MNDIFKLTILKQLFLECAEKILRQYLQKETFSQNGLLFNNKWPTSELNT